MYPVFHTQSAVHYIDNSFLQYNINPYNHLVLIAIVCALPVRLNTQCYIHAKVIIDSVSITRL